MEAGIQGQVVIQIVIDKDGKIHDPKIVRGVSPELNAEAIRVISNMPQWIPGKQKGKTWQPDSHFRSASVWLSF